MKPLNTLSSSEQNSKNTALAKVAFACSIVCLLLLIVVIFAGKNQIEKTRMAFGERIQQESTSLKFLKDELIQSADIYKDLKTRFDLLEDAQKEAVNQRISIEEMYNTLLASKNEVSLSEIEQLVSLAKRQLFLLGNVKGAILALTHATELLEKSEKPTLIRLKTGIEKDLAELKALPTEDLLQLAISLDSVIDEVETLPMLTNKEITTQSTLLSATNNPVNDVAPQDQSVNVGWVWNKLIGFGNVVWQDVKSLVEITTINSPEVLLLSEKQATDIRNTLRLMMLNARLSLLSRHADLLKSDVSRSTKLLNIYFDPKAPQTIRAVKVLNDLQKVQLNLVLPELENTSAALRLALSVTPGEGDAK